MSHVMILGDTQYTHTHNQFEGLKLCLVQMLHVFYKWHRAGLLDYNMTVAQNGWNTKSLILNWSPKFFSHGHMMLMFPPNQRVKCEYKAVILYKFLILPCVIPIFTQLVHVGYDCRSDAGQVRFGLNFLFKKQAVQAKRREGNANIG